MADATTLNFYVTDANYTEEGSRYGFIRNINPDCTEITGEELFARLPAIGKGKYDAGSRSTKEVQAADKKPFAYIPEVLKGGFEFDLLAGDVRNLKFLSQTVEGRYYQAFVPLGVSHKSSSDGKFYHGFLFFPKGIIEQIGTEETPDGKMLKMKFNALPAPSAVTITDDDLVTATTDEIKTLCELDGTAWAAFTATCAIGKMSEPCSCQMT